MHNFDLRCIFLGNSVVDFDTAAAFCDTEGGTLFEPTFGKQDQAVQDYYLSNSTNLNFWIGVTDQDTEGRFKYYSNDHVIGYEGWKLEEPKSEGDCAISTLMGWMDEDCDAQSYATGKNKFCRFEKVLEHT